MGFFEKLMMGAILHVSLVQHSMQQDWCALKCDNGETNTMCKYKDYAGQSVGNCMDQKIGTNDYIKKRILGLHNYVRNQMAAGNVDGWPPAANMRQVTWDDESAEVALRWTVQCQPGHDSCRRTRTFPSVGQNWGMVSDAKVYPDGAFRVFQLWLNEISLTSAKKILDKYYFRSSYGHFSALVWADTYKIGCAVVNSTQKYGAALLFKSTVTCNYAPAGNVQTYPMYLRGDPCTKCPSGTTCNPSSSYKNLCAAPNDPANEVPVPIDIGGCPKKFYAMSSVLHAFSTVLVISTAL